METRMFAQISIFANVSLQNVELVGLNSVLLNIIIVHFHSNEYYIFVPLQLLQFRR